MTQISQLPGNNTFGGARKPPSTALRALWRPLRGPIALPADRDTFAEFPGLFPAPPLALARSALRSPWRRLAHFGTPRFRSAHSTCHPRESRAKGPRETSHNSPRRVVEVAALASSRLRAGSLTQDPRAALRRSAEASGACIRQARIALRFWVGAQGPGQHEKGYDHEVLRNALPRWHQHGE